VNLHTLKLEHNRLSGPLLPGEISSESFSWGFNQQLCFSSSNSSHSHVMVTIEVNNVEDRLLSPRTRSKVPFLLMGSIPFLTRQGG
jgi:hypothetical protein